MMGNQPGSHRGSRDTEGGGAGAEKSFNIQYSVLCPDSFPDSRIGFPSVKSAKSVASSLTFSLPIPGNTEVPPRRTGSPSGNHSRPSVVLL